MAGLQGKIFSGYQLAEQVNGGGIAEVYRAHPQTPGGREAIVKVIYPEFAQQKGFLPHFREIVKLSQRLATHPHILPLLASGEEGGYLYLVTPYVAAGTLKDWIARGQRLGVSDTGPFFRQLCDALGYAHSLDIVHSNIKPSNIFLFEGRHVLLGDFGRLWDISMLREFAQMDVAHSAEAVEYLAPEVASGRATHLSDIYSVGAVLAAAITGQAPFRGATLGEMLAAHERQPAPHLQQISSGLSPAMLTLDPVTQRALAKRPEERFPSAAALSLAIEGTLRQAPASAAMPLMPQPGAWSTAAPVAGGLVAGAGLAAAAAGSPALQSPALPAPVSPVLQTLNPPFPPLPSSEMVDETMEHGRVNLNPNPTPTKAETARVPAPQPAVKKDIDLRPTMRVPAPQPPMPQLPAPGEQQNGSWNAAGRGDAAMLPAISPASLKQLAEYRENSGQMVNSGNHSASPPRYDGPDNGEMYSEWQGSRGPQATADQVSGPPPMMTEVDRWRAEVAGPDSMEMYASGYTNERNAYPSLPDQETGRYQSPDNWDGDGYSDGYSGEYPSAGYYGEGEDSRELERWDGEDGRQGRRSPPREFSATELGLPRLTSPSMAADPSTSWKDIASGALPPAGPRDQRDWSVGSMAGGGADMSSSWGESREYSQEYSQVGGAVPGYNGQMLEPDASQWPDLESVSSRRRMGSRLDVPFEDQRVWTNSMGAVGRRGRWIRWLIPVILLLALLDVGLVAVVRPDLCPSKNVCQVISAKAHQVLPFFKGTGATTTVALNSNPPNISLQLVANKTASQTVKLTNSGTAAAHWKASSGQNWLTLDTATGILDASDSTTLTVTVNATGLHAGSYSADITITGGDQALHIPVTVTVTTG